MYTGYLFIIAFAILVANAVCDDSITVNSDGNMTSISTDELCRTAGFVKDTTKTVTDKTVPDKTVPAKGESKPAASTKMSTADIILTVLGVTAGVLILGFVGHYFYTKQKVH